MVNLDHRGLPPPGHRRQPNRDMEINRTPARWATAVELARLAKVQCQQAGVSISLRASHKSMGFASGSPHQLTCRIFAQWPL